FLVDLNEVDSDGFLIKREVADLLNIGDPRNLAGLGPIFRFPFVTIESVIPLGKRHLGVLNDNNYPFSSGRTPGEPDANEFIIIRLDEPLVHDRDGNDD
ncbi:MAG: PEP-CTERM sorting domain-containing protein, partial [Vicinamibacterales bacterium]